MNYYEMKILCSVSRRYKRIFVKEALLSIVEIKLLYLKTTRKTCEFLKVVISYFVDIVETGLYTAFGVSAFSIVAL